MFFRYVISTRYLVSKHMGHCCFTQKSVTTLISPMSSNTNYTNNSLRDYIKASIFFPKEVKIYSIFVFCSFLFWFWFWFVFLLTFNLYFAFHATSLSTYSYSPSAGWYLSSEHLRNDGVPCSPLKFLFRPFLKNHSHANFPLTLLSRPQVSAHTTEQPG